MQEENKHEDNELVDLSAHSIDVINRKSVCVRLLTKHMDVIGGKQVTEKKLTLLNLLFLGISCAVGCGAYSVIGYAAQKSGPSIVISFIITGGICFFTCFPYAEFAAKIPSAGFGYSYAYATCGEFIAFLVAHNIHLNLIATAALAARTWSTYVPDFLQYYGLKLPTFLYSYDVGDVNICILGVIIVSLLCLLMLRGMQESTIVNNIVSLINISTLAFCLITGYFYVTSKRYENFFTNGYQGVFSGMGLSLFAYLGFEGLACFTEESVNPQRDIPLSLAVILLLAIIVNAGIALVMTGLAPLEILGCDDSLITAFGFNPNSSWTVPFIYIGAIAGLTSSISANLLGQPKIFYTMACHGLLPSIFAKRNSKTGVYKNSVIFTWIIAVFITLLFKVEIIGNAVSLCGTIVSAVVDISVVIARYETPQRHPKGGNGYCLFFSSASIACIVFFVASLMTGFSFYYDWSMIFKMVWIGLMIMPCVYLQVLPQTTLPATFQCPLVPTIPFLGASSMLFIASTIDAEAWKMYIVYMAFGVVFYFLYSFNHSACYTGVHVNTDEDSVETNPTTVELINVEHDHDHLSK